MSELQGLFFWGFLLAFGAVMYLVVPKSKDEAGFFRGHDSKGRPASEWALMMSIFISWIFAKSVTNAANLGAAYGIVGGLAYASYWLSIPVAGLVIYRLRTREGATGVVPFLIGKYGVLLGTNLYGLALCTAGFFLPLALPRYRMNSA